MAFAKNKEKYIADFYFKTKVYDAARFRYENILTDFRDPELRSHAVLRIFEASENLGEPQYCKRNKDIYTAMVAESYKKDLNKVLDDCLKATPKPKEEEI